jgi:branched-chain amino acid transport system permease protein
VTQSPRYRAATGAFLAAAVAVVALVPALLTPSRNVLYATSAALALGAVSVAVAWMFAGEVALGHWGLAGLGAAVAAVTPGPWAARAAVAALAMAAGGAVLALASRRQSSLSFAVISLAAAAAAPVALIRAGRHLLTSDPGVVGAIAAAIAVVTVALVARLRSSIAGARMVAARDDPQRASWLGANPLRGRVLGLALSGGLAGLAGALYLAATASPGGIAPGAFNPSRSLDLLTMAVIGGLGSPSGALFGAVAVQAARHGLPESWALLASGTGVLLVVIFRPGGLSRTLQWLRDRAVSLIVPPERASTVGTPVIEAAREAVKA